MRLLPREKARSEAKKYANATYEIDHKNGRLGRKIGGEKALKQAVGKILSTFWRNHDVYNDGYGFENQNLVAKDTAYIRVEVKRRIREALMFDDRVTKVDSFVFASCADSDAMLVGFTVRSVYGDDRIEQVIRL